MRELATDILIVGGGVGGCAAALAATDAGRRVVMTEPNHWIGGQLTAQGVPPDEHPWIETDGRTRRYAQFRAAVRSCYQQHFPLTQAARRNTQLNPGGGHVSSLCHEPYVAWTVLLQMLAPAVSANRLTLLTRTRPVAAEVNGDRITAVTFMHRDTADQTVVTADYVLDASELGDVLPLAGLEYVTGAESQSDTGEPHAPTGPAQPDNMQAMTWCMAAGYDPTPGADHVGDPPEDFEYWSRYAPELSPAWTGPLLSWLACHAITLEPRTFQLFGDPDASDFHSLWHYRRVTCADHYPPEHRPHEATLLNWPQNDYLDGHLIDQPDELIDRHEYGARQLTLSLLYWLQTRAPRLDGGTGFPGLYPRGAMLGTRDGLAQAAYVREARRIRPMFRVTEQHVGYDASGGRPAEPFSDSVGTGYYRIDLHPSTGGDNYIDIASVPFEIPLGALLPVGSRNLLAAGKCLGVTHITNGCYRLHPVEWNVGESAGALAAWCVDQAIEPHAVQQSPSQLQAFQASLDRQGVMLHWPESIIESHVHSLQT